MKRETEKLHDASAARIVAYLHRLPPSHRFGDVSRQATRAPAANAGDVNGLRDNIGRLEI